MSFGCFISAQSRTNLAAVKQGNTSWKNWCPLVVLFLPVVMQPWWSISFSTFKLNTEQLKLILTNLCLRLAALVLRRWKVLPAKKKNGKCALNDSVFKFKIYSVEMQTLITNANLAGLSVGFSVRFRVRLWGLWPRTSASIYKSFSETLIYLVHSHTSTNLSSCFDLQVLMGNTYTVSF